MKPIVIAIVVAAIVLVIIAFYRLVRIVPQQRMDVVERLGRYHRTLKPGLNLLVPFFDSVRTKVDMREQVVSFPPQPVITADNLVVSIDTVLYFKVVDPVRATYEIASGPRRTRRAQPRAHVELHAHVTSEAGCFDGTVRDIGIGGLFIESDTVPEYGQRVDVELTLDPHGPASHMAAVVRWTKDGGFGAQLAPGTYLVKVTVDGKVVGQKTVVIEADSLN